VWAFFAWSTQWALGLKQKAVSFSKLMLAMGVGFAPLAVAAILGFFYVWLGKGRFADFTAGPLLLVPFQSTSTMLGHILRRLDLFELSAVMMTGLALHYIFLFRKKTVMKWVWMVWVVLVVGVGLLKGVI